MSKILCFSPSGRPPLILLCSCVSVLTARQRLSSILGSEAFSLSRLFVGFFVVVLLLYFWADHQFWAVKRSAWEGGEVESSFFVVFVVFVIVVVVVVFVFWADHQFWAVKRSAWEGGEVVVFFVFAFLF